METEAAGERMTFKVPREAIAVVLVVLLAPLVVVLTPLMWRYPSLRTADLLIALESAGRPDVFCEVSAFEFLNLEIALTGPRSNRFRALPSRRHGDLLFYHHSR